MAEEHKEGPGALEEFGVVIGVVLLLVGIWWIRGKPGSSDIRRGLFVAPPAPIGNGQVFGSTLEGSTTPTAPSAANTATTTSPTLPY